MRNRAFGRPAVSRTLSVLLVLPALLLGCSHHHSSTETVPGDPETFVFEQELDGYAGFDDTTIFSESEFSGGATPGVYSGTIHNLAFDGSRQHRRALIRADLSSIPSDWTVEDVRLRLTVRASGGNFGDINYGLHRLNTSWGEGDVVGLSEGGFGASANDGDATWISRHHNDLLWNTHGGDFELIASASAVAGRIGVDSTWISPELIDDVQAWISTPANNHGWIIVSELEGTRQRVKRFYSSESDMNRPHLIIVARPPDQPAPSNNRFLVKAIKVVRDLLEHVKFKYS